MHYSLAQNILPHTLIFPTNYLKLICALHNRLFASIPERLSSLLWPKEIDLSSELYMLGYDILWLTNIMYYFDFVSN